MRETCPSCGGVIEDTYCAACGERRPSSRIYTLKAFAHEAFEVFTNVERSFLATLWRLVRWPGELTAAYMRGRRVRYLRPLQLFVLVNVIFFVWAGWQDVHVFTTRFSNHVYSAPYKELAREVYRVRQPASGLTPQEYELAFDQKSAVLARSLIIVMGPLYALALAVLTFRRRPRPPAVQHIVFSVHFLTMVLVLTIVNAYVVLLVYWLSIAVGHPIGDGALDQFAGYIMALAVSVYLYAAFRRSYSDGRWGAIAKTIVSLVVLTYLLVGYRLVLFYLTAYSL